MKKTTVKVVSFLIVFVMLLSATGCEFPWQKKEEPKIEYKDYGTEIADFKLVSIDKESVTFSFTAPENAARDAEDIKNPISAYHICVEGEGEELPVIATVNEDAMAAAGETQTVVLPRKAEYKTDLTEDVSFFVVAEDANGETVQTASVTVPAIRQIVLDGDMCHYGAVRGMDFSGLYNEQTSSGDPKNGTLDVPTRGVQYFSDANQDLKVDEADRTYKFEMTVDLGRDTYLDSVYLYYGSGVADTTVYTGTPFAWENNRKVSPEKYGWTEVRVDRAERYFSVEFENGKAPLEVIVYASPYGEPDPVNTEPHPLPKLGDMIGMNAFVNDSTLRTEGVGYVREYHNFGWTCMYSNYPNAMTYFNGTSVGSFDSYYRNLTRAGKTVVPTIQWGSLKEIYTGETPADRYKPSSYIIYASCLYQYAAHFGSNENVPEDTLKMLTGKQVVGRGDLSWIEVGNEPDGDFSGTGEAFNAYQLAALTSAAYDGHCGTLGADVGIKTADPNMGVSMSGLAGIQTRYIKDMMFWFRFNRPDGSPAVNAFNVHEYTTKTIRKNGYKVSVGISPEEADFGGRLKELLDFRDRYYPDIEVWLTEFGWDTSKSYECETAAHAYGDYTSRQVQAMWLVRAYLIFSTTGVDKTAMYMSRDEGSEETSGKYGTCGVVAKDGKYKDSYYYIYTLYSRLGDMRFKEAIPSGNDNVWVYRFESDDGKSAYALWCPTSDGTKVDGYKLNVGSASSASLVTMQFGEKQGVESALTVASNSVTVDVSECPVFVMIG